MSSSNRSSMQLLFLLLSSVASLSTIDENAVAKALGVPAQQVHALVGSLDGAVMSAVDRSFNATAHEEFYLPPWLSPKAVSPTVVLVLANSSRDVQRAVAWSARNGVALSPAAGRHGSAGYALKSALTVDTRRMKHLALDPAGALTLTAGAGVLLGDVIDFLDPLGYVAATGVCAPVGLGGWTLGGGYGPFGKLMGLGADNVVAMEVVLADGTLVTANASGAHADLFWALRGAGHQSFGVVVSYTIRVKKLPSFVYWNIDIPMEREPEAAAAVLGEWKRLYYSNATWTASVLTTYSVRFGRHNATADMVMNFEMLWPSAAPSATADFRAMLAPLTAFIEARFPGAVAAAAPPSVKSFRAVKTFDDAFASYVTPRNTAEGKAGFYLKPDLTDLTALVTAALTSLAITREFRPTSNSTIFGFYMVLEPYVGAIAAPASDDTAFSHRGANTMGDFYIDFFLDLDAAATGEGCGLECPKLDFDEGMRWLQSFAFETPLAGSPFLGGLLEQYTNASVHNGTTFTAYQNYKQMEFGEGASGRDAADVLGRWPALVHYHSSNLCRLVEVKRVYDPELVFDFAQGIPLITPPGMC